MGLHSASVFLSVKTETLALFYLSFLRAILIKLARSVLYFLASSSKRFSSSSLSRISTLFVRGFSIVGLPIFFLSDTFLLSTFCPYLKYTLEPYSKSRGFLYGFQFSKNFLDQLLDIYI